MPDDPTGSPAPSNAPPEGGDMPPPGPAPSGAPAGAGTPPGVTPPTAGPTAQSVRPQGAVLSAQIKGSLVLKALNEMLSAYHPDSDEWKTITDFLRKGAKFWPQNFGPKIGQPPMTGGAPGGMPPGAGMPPMSGGPGAGRVQPGPPPMAGATP